MGFRILLLTSAVFIVQQWRCSYYSAGEGRLPQCLSLPMLDLVSRHSLRKSKNVISVLGGSVNNFDVLIGFEGQSIGYSFPGEAWEPVASTTVPRIVTQVK